jgi:hypothetical protein
MRVRPKRPQVRFPQQTLIAICLIPQDFLSGQPLPPGACADAPRRKNEIPIAFFPFTAAD